MATTTMDHTADLRLLEHLPSLVGYWGSDLRLVLANRAYRAWFAADPEELIGKHITELLAPDVLAGSRPFIEGALAGHPQHVDRAVAGLNGARTHMQVSYLPDRDDAGLVVGFFVVAADVTARVLAEKALVEQERVSAQLVRQLGLVGRVSAALHEREPDEVHDCISDAVVELGYAGTTLAVISWRARQFSPSHGRGPFAPLDGKVLPLRSGATQQVLETGAPVVVPDYQVYEHALPIIRASGIRSTVSLPVITRGRVGAVLHVGTMRPAKIGHRDVEVLSLLAHLAGAALGNAQRLTSVRQQAETASVDASTDALTGAGNRRAADLLLARIRPDDVLALVDLDHFKAVNDTRGHAVGDATLCDLVQTIRQQIRDSDAVARVGGEEFLVLLRTRDLTEAEQVLERVRRSWLARSPATTFSAGLARADASERGQDVYRRADDALYRAKRAGRDRSVAADLGATG